MSNKPHKSEFEKMLERKVAEEEAQKKTAPTPQTETAGAPCENSAASSESDGALEQALQQVASLQEENAQSKDQLLRARAEFDNYRKRVVREMDQVRQTASINLIRALLPALDNLERALAHANEEDGLAEGVRMVYKQIQDTLAAEGLEPIAARGEVFDPTYHDALATTPSDSIAAGVIAEEYERGYKLRDLVLRPAKVIVSAGPETTEQDEEAPSTGNQAGEGMPEISE